MPDHFLGVDIGGTTTTLCVGDQDHHVRHLSDQFATPSKEGPNAVVSVIVEQALAALELVGVPIDDVARVGLATPGPATPDGVLHMTPNLDPALWDQCPIRARLEQAFQVHNRRVKVDYLGDGQAAALGEYSIRSRRYSWDRVPTDSLPEQVVASLFMVIVGTGLGGGAVRAGVPIRGSEGRAGHVGHILLPADAFRYEHDRTLRVGNALCAAESAISLTGLTHQLGYRLGLPEWRTHPLNNAEGTVRDKAKRLRELAGNGDPLALELFDDQARALGIALLSVNYLGDYDRLVIGGGVCDLSPTVRERTREHAENAYREHALDGFRNLDRFEFSVCGDEAPTIGALSWAHARHV